MDRGVQAQLPRQAVECHTITPCVVCAQPTLSRVCPTNFVTCVFEDIDFVQYSRTRYPSAPLARHHSLGKVATQPLVESSLEGLHARELCCVAVRLVVRHALLADRICGTATSACVQGRPSPTPASDHGDTDVCAELTQHVARAAAIRAAEVWIRELSTRSECIR